jgi:lysophospholipase L1-like esterase
MRSLPGISKFVLWTAVILFASAAQAGEFPLRDGDVVAMAGDSITAQHLHSNYIEAYCVTRFPKWNLQFRNAGVGGDTVPRVLARLDTDVLCWKPTVVTIELGMNDAGGGPQKVEPYIKQMETLIDRIKAAGARPIFLTASPVNDGTTSADLKGHELTLDKMATAIVELAARQKLACADQFHALLDLWGNNQKSPNVIPLGGDGVHPGPVGQLTMAYACLVGLDAPGLVSSVLIDTGNGGKVAAASNCTVKDLKIDETGISFERTDDCLPMPIPKEARDALKLVPLSAKLNQYLLSVQFDKTRIVSEKWDVSIDGKKVATISKDDLWSPNAWNMSELTEGPIAEQCQVVLNLIRKKEAAVSAYRDVANWKAPAWLDDPALYVAGKQKAELDRLMKKVIEATAEVNAAAQPKPHHFEIAPAK